MSCLYCGKEIGPFRLLQDADFCTSAHRKQYERRLSLGFGQLLTPELKSTRTAGFRQYLPARLSAPRIARDWDFQCGHHTMLTERPWSVNLPPVLTGMFARTAPPQVSAPPSGHTWVMDDAPMNQIRRRALALEPAGLGAGFAGGLERLAALLDSSIELASAGEATSSQMFTPLAPPLEMSLAAETPAEQPPALCEIYCPSPRPEAAERFVAATVAEELGYAIPERFPVFTVPAASLLGERALAPATEWMTPRAEAAERMVFASVAGELSYTSMVTLPGVNGLTATGTLRRSAATGAPATKWMTPRAEAVERMVFALVAGEMSFAARVALPGIDVLAAVPIQSRQTVEEPATEWMTSAAEAAERLVAAPVADELGLAAPLAMSGVESLAAAGAVQLQQALQAPSTNWMTLRAEAAERMVAARMAGEAGFAARVALPGMTGLAVSRPQAPSIAMWKQQAAAGADPGSPAPTVPALEPATIVYQPQAQMALATEAPREESLEPPAAGDAWMALPRAEAAERFVNTAFAEATDFAMQAKLPTLAGFEPVRLQMPGTAEWIQPAAQAAGIDAPALNPQAPAFPLVAPAAMVRQPEMRVEIAGDESREPVQIPAASEVWMTMRAEAAERTVRQAFAEAPGFVVATAQPGISALPVSRPFIPRSAQWMKSRAAEPVQRDAAARTDVIFEAAPAAAPALPANLDAAVRAAGSTIPVNKLSELPKLAAAESAPAAAAYLELPIVVAASLIAPAAPAAAHAKFTTAAFQSVAPRSAQPAEAIETEARLEPICGIEVELPLYDLVRPRPIIPVPALLTMEYYAGHISHAPIARPGWMARTIPPMLQGFTMEAANERLEAVAAPKPSPSPKPETKVRELPKTRVYNNNPGMDRTAKIAAGLMFAAILWLGSRSINFGNNGSNVGVGGASDVSVAMAKKGKQPAAQQPTGTMARMRHAIAERASVEMTDSFRSGMQNWGASGKSWTPGWSHHKDGYVHTGELALFAPSSNFTDYRLEFYGQVESKSMGWVVRAKDKQNYYAMKVSVLEPGLRPVIAMVHYPVIGGKRGHRVETPLNVMVHNNRPYHVAVDVRGNRFTASIEGEQVGSWIDESPASGAIGFFSDAGERSRLYWMKVSKNQDWIGKICSLIAGPGDGTQTTAEIWGPAIPAPPRVPSKPRPQEVAVTATLESLPAKFNQTKRTNQWNS